MDSVDLPDFTAFDVDLASALVMSATGSVDSSMPSTHVSQLAAPLMAYDAFLGVSPVPVDFGPAFQAYGALPDIQLITADNAAFFAHRRVLQNVSTNAFAGLLTSAKESISIPETSDVLAIALRVVYGLSCLHLANTSLEAIESALKALQKYGVAVQKFAAPHWPLFQLIITHAPHRPIEAYALAAEHRLEDLAVAVSAHLLAYNLSSLTDELTAKMGPVYFKRLFHLHQTRRDALKNIVMVPPAMHHPNLACGPEQQAQLIHAWAIAAADMAWNASASTSTYMLQFAFERAGRDITCVECRAMLNTRIQEAVAEWSLVPRTI